MAALLMSNEMAILQGMLNARCIGTALSLQDVGGLLIRQASSDAGDCQQPDPLPENRLEYKECLPKTQLEVVRKTEIKCGDNVEIM